jgi:hypothetical protein
LLLLRFEELYGRYKRLNFFECFSKEFLVVLIVAAEGESKRIVCFLLTEVNASYPGGVLKFTKMFFKHILPK